MTHHIINEKRNESQMRFTVGPKVLILGSSLSGKNTLCHILLNYGIRLGWTPLFVDLDLSNEIALPGTISATLVDYNLPVLIVKAE